MQTISAPGTDGVAGGVTQVRAVTAALVAIAKERGIATVLVGHVTKDGQVAGPRVLEHLVDVVLTSRATSTPRCGMVRGLKNRFGAADEVGCFEMHEGGITSLPDPCGLFLTRYADAVSGTCVSVAMEGRRALVAEVQTLIGAADRPAPPGARSAASTRPAGHDPRRPAAARADPAPRPRGLSRRRSAASGSSSRPPTWRWRSPPPRPPTTSPLPPDLVAIGEVGLTGEVRRVGAVPRRLAEAARLGFRFALVRPAAARPLPAPPPG